MRAILGSGIRQGVVHGGVAAVAAVRGVDGAEVERLDGGGQRGGGAAVAALGGDGATLSPK